MIMKPDQGKGQKEEKKRQREDFTPPNTPSSRPPPNKMVNSEDVSLSDIIGKLRLIRGSIERLEQNMAARMVAVEH